MTQEPGQQGPGQPDPGQQGPWSAAPPTQPVAGGADPWHQPPAEPASWPAGQQQQQPPAEPPRQQPVQQAGPQQPWQSTGTTLTLPPTPVLVRIAQLAAPVLLVVALVIPLDESMPLRSHTLWALWALAGAVLQALPAIGVGGTVEKRWTLAAVGAGALALYWLLVTLPSVATSGGFLVTLATACAVAGVLLSPGRRL